MEKEVNLIAKKKKRQIMIHVLQIALIKVQVILVKFKMKVILMKVKTIVVFCNSVSLVCILLFLIHWAQFNQVIITKWLWLTIPIRNNNLKLFTMMKKERSNQIWNLALNLILVFDAQNEFSYFTSLF